MSALLRLGEQPAEAVTVQSRSPPCPHQPPQGCTIPIPALLSHAGTGGELLVLWRGWGRVCPGAPCCGGHWWFAGMRVFCGAAL